MSTGVRFWRNVTLIGLAHVAVIYGLIRWNRESKPANAQSIVWMNGGGGGGDGAATPTATPKPVEVASPSPELTPTPPEESEEDRSVLAAARSDIQLPAPTPTATPTPRPKPSSTPLVKGTPKPTPKPVPKPTPKPKPKPSPKKLILARASPKPSPTLKPTPEESVEDNEQAAHEAEKEQIAKAALDKVKPETIKNPTVAPEGRGRGTSAGAGGHAAGGSGESQFGWYGSMLHDRFYSEWIQPTSSLEAGAKASALVKIRIEKDGRVSSFEIVKGSGNAMVDESVTAIAKRVTRVDPLPAGLGDGKHYDVKVNFELSSEQ